MSHPFKVRRVEKAPSQSKRSLVKLSDENLFRMLADEIPVPSLSEDSKEGGQVRGRLDRYIVDTLPREFWGSRFYLDSDVVVEREQSPEAEQTKKLVDAGSSLIDELASIVNSKDIHVLSHFNSRFSRRRTKRFLDSVQSDTQYVVDPM